ncbi:fk506 binding protein, putative [Perkinsus marinus ATCC 50983]|uniref:Fk506 binding protein, putative n=1 Tax=Perkinsus marinus (strain ATCC 50983 / TXsc) TaxID=423536 RepID=C5KAA9_PERM5|nr:fk506 binding protein, putative [Perkinsus marinus ATCC 50983]EER18570.1 fk506 binding protein, putative [Perkinsus marinus ATCC 50983]|eukprot:XP_002786774.1 fk506 binding protein, putative [Perkinsus marinus ATCC 50983]
MFTPEMMQAAQNMMANMTPEQMAQMTEMAKNMDPNMMRNMMGGQGMPPGGVSREQMDQVGISDSGGLDNVKSYSTPTVLALQKALCSNAALCCLKLEKYDECREYCDQVLQQDPKAVKALYRRGVAYRELKEIDKAYLDLSIAARLSPNDEVLVSDFEAFKESLPDDYVVPTEEEPVVNEREVSAKLASDPEMVMKMQKVMKDMTPEEMNELRNVQLTGSAPGNSAAARKFAEKLRSEDPEFVERMKDVVGSLPQEQIDQLRKTAASGTAPATTAASSSSTAPRMPPTGSAGLAEATRMMKENPDVMNQMSDMMAGMSDEQFDSMLKMSGMGASSQDAAAMRDMMRNKDMMKAMGDMMKNMSPEQMNAMSQASAQTTAPVSNAAGSEGSTAAEVPKMPDHPGDIFKDPRMLKSMEAMISSMPDDVLENLIAQQAAGSQAAGPDGKAALPRWLSGRVIKFFLRIIMKFARLVIFIRNLFAAMFSRRGKYIIALLVLIFAIYQQYFTAVEDASE